ncbi:ankyrin repeat domain-containing protein, partial [uncultured Campylobacter sp.]|uniref:ankyrin repeat domain-containing protein n=1 Tax=uncultured Campylobacter sp. TaxID=218934 RepID=UPI002619ADFE
FVFCGTLFGASCEQMQEDARGFFGASLSDEELLQSDFGCQGSLLNAPFLQSLRQSAAEIRGENVDCVGNKALVNEKKFERVLAFAGMDGEGFLSYAKDKNHDAIYQKSFEALEFYSERTIGNFIKYRNFKRELAAAEQGLKTHFAASFDETRADELAAAVIAEFASYAANDREVGARSELELALKQGVSADEFNALLFSKSFASYELDDALDLALLLGYDKRFISTLIEQGAQVNAGEENSLFYAMSSIENARLMISKGAQVNYKNSLGQTPIFYAVAMKNYELVKLLIYNHASVNVRQISSTEMQALASLGGTEDTCTFAFTGAGETLLMYAAQNGTKQIVELLVRSGANEKLSDEAGLNVMDYAILGGDVQTQSYLKSIGLKPSESLDDEGSDGAPAKQNEL